MNAIEEEPHSGYRCTPLDCATQYPEMIAYLRSQGAKTLDEIEGGDASPTSRGDEPAPAGDG